ncbi:MAG: hypothetical protein WCP93_00015 [Candidatus Berkelbacteria bacterium]
MANDNQETVYHTVFEGPGGALMVEKYLNDEEAEVWLKGLEENGTIGSRKDYKRWQGGEFSK